LLVQGAGDADARAWLERIRQAATTSNYQGTMVFSAGGSMSSSRVWHYCVGDQTYERLEAQDGRQQQVLRHNEEVRTLWPQSRVAVAEKREALAAWSTTPQRVEPRALENYELRREGAARVAGRDAAVFLLEPRDGLRFAQRLWADQATGLMLRADVLGPGHSLLESAAFSEIEIGVKPQPETVLQAMRKLDAKGDARPDGKEGWRVLRPPQRRTQLDAEGWALSQTVPGFKLAGCMVRAIETAGEAVSVLQAVFSDGLTHVSVFIEPFRAQRHRGELNAQLGATGTVTRRQGEFWITAVGDVPPATLKQFAESLERRR
jgi:sigma-E factor negative regulatory protein RseB